MVSIYFIVFFSLYLYLTILCLGFTEKPLTRSLMGCSDGLVTLQFLSARDIPSATYVIGKNPYLKHFFYFFSFFPSCPILSFLVFSCSILFFLVLFQSFLLFLAFFADFIVNAIVRNKIYHDGNCS